MEVDPEDLMHQIEVPFEGDDGDLTAADFPSICRTCLARSSLIPIFGLQSKQFSSKTKLTIHHLLRECVALKAKENDLLPQNICVTCLKKLMEMYYYQKQCFLNQARLKLVVLETQPFDLELEQKIKEEEEDDDYVSQKIEEEVQEGDKLVGYISHEGDWYTEDAITKEDIDIDETQEDNQDVLEDIAEEGDEVIMLEQHNDDEVGEEYHEQYVDEYGRQVVYKYNDVEQEYDDGEEVPQEYDENYVQDGEEVVMQRCDEEMVIQGKEVIVQRDEEGNLISFGDVDTYEEVYDDGNYEEATEEHYANAEAVYRDDAEEQTEQAYSPKYVQVKNNTREVGTADEVVRIAENVKRGRKPGFQSLGRGQPQELKRLHEHCPLLPPGVEKAIIDKYECEVCLRVMKRGYHFLRHLRKCHPDKFRLVCDGVQRRGAAPDENGEEQPPPCGTCERLLRAVARRDSGKQPPKPARDKRHLCSVCGLSFFSKASLDSHFRRHTGERPFVCQVCKKTFSQGCGLDAHMRTHTGDKPFKCPYCERRFTQAAHLITHVKTHTGERPYPCSHCGKRFALKGNLVVHERTHTGETPYLCMVCGKGFYDSSSRNKHQKGHENGDFVQRGRKRKQDTQQQQQQQQRWKAKQSYATDDDDSSSGDDDEDSSDDSDDSMMH